MLNLKKKEEKKKLLLKMLEEESDPDEDLGTRVDFPSMFVETLRDNGFNCLVDSLLS